MRTYAKILSLTAILAVNARAAAPAIDLLQSTPVGSWQIRQQTTTNSKGETVVLTTKTSLVGEEQRNGEAHVWIEMAMDTKKTDKKGKSKDVDTVLCKALVKRSAFVADAANAARNPLGAAAEVILQAGGRDPIRYSGKNLAKAGDAFGLQVDYAWQVVGTESVTVPAGTFQATHMRGTASASTKIVFKRIDVQSEGDWWYSTSVPFGMVKGEGKNIVNGKPETFTMQLQSHGSSGAASQITGVPMDLPSLGDLFKGGD